MVYGTIKTVQAGCWTYFAQCIATVGVLMVMLQTGILVGWTSPNIARLTGENSPIPINLNEASWVASCLNLGRIIGAFLVPLLIECAGSKKTILCALLPISSSWILLILAKSVEWLYASRLLGGVMFGMAYGSFSLFLGEVSRPAIRGTLISLAMCGALLGSVFGTIGESYLPMTVSSSTYLAVCAVTIILFLWLPESPYHLAKKNNLEGARKSINWYRGGFEVDKELDRIKSFVDSNVESDVKSKLLEFKSPPIRRAMIVVIILFIFPQMCGLFNIMFYMEVILTKGKSFLINPQEFVVYANVISVISITLAIRLIDILGRRFLLIVSSIGTTTALAGLGLHFYLLNSDVDPKSIEWLPIIFILLFTITFNIGFMVVPSTVLSEIFPSNVKSVAACIASLTSAFFGFVAAKSYQPMIDAIGETYVFWIHGVFSILATPCALFLLPETKGKSFQEIQNDLFKR